MNQLSQAFSRSIGGKLAVAVTGLGLILFLIAHVSGNLLVFGGPEAINGYAEGLREYPALLWSLRIGLIAMFVLHIVFAIRLNIKNQAARPVKYVKKQFVRASFASRYMVLSGLLVLFYVLFHLAHFTFRVTSAEIAQHAQFDVYSMMITSFRDPLVSITYIAAMLVLGLHLHHGFASVFQTLGWNSKAYGPLIHRAGPVIAWLIAAAYISIPVAVFTGILR